MTEILKIRQALDQIQTARTLLDQAEITLQDALSHPAEPAGRWAKALLALEPDHPTGAWGMSDQTARSQVNMEGGREASKRIVTINWQRIQNQTSAEGSNWQMPEDYLQRVEDAASKAGLPVPLLLAVFCRETHHGFQLDRRGYGDHGNGFGVGQVDGRYHTQRGRPAPYSPEHMHQAAEIFADYLAQAEDKHPDWADKHLLKAAAVAYNSGIKNVATIQRMDRGTTGNDYGADVCARAQFYAEIIGQ